MRFKTASLALIAALFSAESANAGGPVLVELFTSQGCNSCPPADAYLGDLAKRKDVVALAFHVDYWDHIGWKDPFGDAAWTARQRKYSQALMARQIYTPQMIDDGIQHAIGSDRRSVERLIASAAKAKRPTLEVIRSPSGLDLKIDGAGDAEIWIVGYDPKHETKVPRGENAGRVLAEFNVVRGLKRLDAWKGGPVTRAVAASELPPGTAHAILLQENDLGPVLAVATAP